MRPYLNVTILIAVAALGSMYAISMYAIRVLLVLSLCSCLNVACSDGEAYAERVGYSFSGNFIQPVWSGVGTPPTQNSIFGTVFPFTAPFSGSFSFDTTAIAATPFSGTRDYKQQIQGGFKFNVLASENGPTILKLMSNAYSMRVSNDFTPAGTPIASDLLSVEFNTLADPSLPSIIKDGVPYTRKPIVITAPISWDWQKFNEPDDPKLRSSLDMSEFFPYPGNIFASNNNAAFVISSFSRIVPVDGDYNVDGVVDGSDYMEWRKAYGKISEDFAHADGNHNGTIGSDDFVVWRHALALSSGVGTSLVPEPSIATLLAILLGHIVSSRRRVSCA